MVTHVIELIEHCIAELREGTLTESKLRAAADALRVGATTQNLLYLQTATSSVTSKVIGMTMLVDGTIDEGPAAYDEWPYKTVAEAIADGWRVIRFPAQLPSAHSAGGHVICEFILERYHDSSVNSQ